MILNIVFSKLLMVADGTPKAHKSWTLAGLLIISSMSRSKDGKHASLARNHAVFSKACTFHSNQSIEV